MFDPISKIRKKNRRQLSQNLIVRSICTDLSSRVYYNCPKYLPVIYRDRHDSSCCCSHIKKQLLKLYCVNRARANIQLINYIFKSIQCFIHVTNVSIQPVYRQLQSCEFRLPPPFAISVFYGAKLRTFGLSRFILFVIM